MASKTVTREQAEAKRQKAVDFLNRIGQSDSADEFDAMGPDEYAEHKGLMLSNSRRNKGRRNCYMPANGQTKADLQEILDNVQEILDSVYAPESSREDLASAVGEALDALTGEEEGEEGDEDLDDDEA
jgi:hypothetical protein